MLNRDLQMQRKSITSSIDNAPAEALNPNSINSRSKGTRRTAVTTDFAKHSRRDDTMYNDSDLKRNIQLENSRESRQLQVDERKRNRAHYRKCSSLLQR